jgi:plasmid stabilization system protein ParE
MVEVSWTDQAMEDIANIADFIAKDSEKFASIQIERFFKQAELIEKNPFAGRIVPEINDKFIRELSLAVIV